jgi:hypothetical protein
MAFPSPITQALAALEDSFSLPEPKRRWWRQREHRLALVKRARQVGQAWRELKAGLEAAGAPAAPWPVTVDPYATFDSEGCSFQRNMLSGQTKLVMNSLDTSLLDLDVSDDLLPLGNVLTLLHEQAHARLSNCLEEWVESLPTELRFHMDWAWEQAPGHPGRKTFHELYADISATAWTLVVGQHTDEAREVVQAMAHWRHETMDYAKEEGVFSPYDTAAAIQAVLAMSSETLSQSTEDHIQRLTVEAFQAWLSNGGQQECDAFVETYSRMSPISIYVRATMGTLPAFANFGESQRHYQGLVKLARELPNHPILRFTQTQWALEYGDPAQQG